MRDPFVLTAPARLHFGLLQPFGHLPEAPELPAFGGVGLAIDSPDLEIEVGPSDRIAFDDPFGSRAEAFARRWLCDLDSDGPAFRLTVRRVLPSHSGLGSGTALAMAVGSALGSWYGTPTDVREIARRVGRGERSAIGIYGSRYGGLIVDAGRRTGGVVSDLAVACPVPPAWQVLLALPRSGDRRWHGSRERAAFETISADVDRVTRTLERLSRVVLLDLLPACHSGDIDRFGEAAFEINTRVGEYFAPVQGGLYASAEIGGVVGWFRSRGLRGAGQSSWGPAAFAIVDRARASGERDAFLARFGPAWTLEICPVSRDGTRLRTLP